MDREKIMWGFAIIVAFFALITFFAETCFLAGIFFCIKRGSHGMAAFLLICFALYVKFG